MERPTNMEEGRNKRERLLEMTNRRGTQQRPEPEPEPEPEPVPEPEPEPEPSCVSFKSDQSHQGLIHIKGEQPSAEKRIHQRPDSAKPEPSCVSFKSDRSNVCPIDFKGEQPSAEKR
ncbi:procyclic form-specific polypeptide B1-alpha-like isoform X2 [Perca fluviatilis]|nr:procyclic form-specific polypeptide B1-alpha-like isoform X2 [Perca fluviatilis]